MVKLLVMDIIILLVSAGILVVSVFLFLKRPKASVDETYQLEAERLDSENVELKIALAKIEERSNLLQNDKQLLTDELNKERNQLSQANQALESSRSYYKAQQEKIAELNQERDKNQEKFNKDFELIASRILDEKTAKFTEQNRNNLDTLLMPLKENIKAFE
ncbi:MAG TPA: hypothetical protein VLZ28_02475, partial [Daejeonella sp.]|nr:hypothetical protein [Daejeonella sp.]